MMSLCSVGEDFGCLILLTKCLFCSQRLSTVKDVCYAEAVDMLQQLR